MNISIKGKLHKVYSGWAVEIPLLDYVIKEDRPLLCLKKLEEKVREELQDKELKCFFKIDDSGIFYLITAQTPELIQYIADKMVDLNMVSVESNLAD